MADNSISNEIDRLNLNSSELNSQTNSSNSNHIYNNSNNNNNNYYNRQASGSSASRHTNRHSKNNSNRGNKSSSSLRASGNQVNQNSNQSTDNNNYVNNHSFDQRPNIRQHNNRHYQRDNPSNDANFYSENANNPLPDLVTSTVQRPRPSHRQRPQQNRQYQNRNVETNTLPIQPILNQENFNNNNSENNNLYESVRNTNPRNNRHRQNQNRQYQNRNVETNTLPIQPILNQENFNNNNSENNNLYEANTNSGNNRQRFNNQNPNKNNKSQRTQNANLSNQNQQSRSKPTESQSQSSRSTYNNNNNNNNNNKLRDTTNLTRREILTEQLKKNKCECMVCCTNIYKDKAIWSCNICFHIFHLHCVRKWALAPAAKVDENSPIWRCPGCQGSHEQIPHKYKCFCGKKTNPENSYSDDSKPFHLHQLPHSCGNLCSRSLTASANFWQDSTSTINKKLECKHKCLDPCHPGPCNRCEALVTRSCNCGKNKFSVKCSSEKIPICDSVCSAKLNCKIHSCEVVCHSGECQPCQVDVPQKCHSHQKERVVKCGDSETTNQAIYSCGEVCGEMLACGNHKCEKRCHQGDCGVCELLPSKLTRCPCGKSAVKELLIAKQIVRTSCREAVPVCDKKCGKVLHVVGDGENEEVHMCEEMCHDGECGSCVKEVEIKCRCGKDKEKIQCFNRDKEFLCNRRCSRKKTCGRHQCNELCCCDKDHICMLTCNRILNCGIHRCEQLCHKSGQCQRCLVASFDERICHCGATVEYPPIRCGTKAVMCSQPCGREHSCSHPVTHNCHWEEKCPPCSFLTSKYCFGNHELRHNIPCYMENISCGRNCDKKLPGCDHRCNRTCHKGACLDGENCVQACRRERSVCGHCCNEPCHPGIKCPETVCQEVVTARCKCGLKSKQVKCLQMMTEVNLNLACELKEMLMTRSIDIGSLKNAQSLRKKSLELACDEECLLAERNRSMAVALQLEPNAKHKAIYSDFLKQYAREEPAYVFDLEKRFEAIQTVDFVELSNATRQRPVRYKPNHLILIGLIKEMKLSKLTKKTYHMPCMKSFERKFIHELASYYGFETQSHDSEPNRNVAIYATKDKCFQPLPTLTQSVEVKPKVISTMSRLSNIRQLGSDSNAVKSNLRVLQSAEVASNYMPLTVNSFSALAEQGDEVSNPREEPKKEIDYFDMI